MLPTDPWVETHGHRIVAQRRDPPAVPLFRAFNPNFFIRCDLAVLMYDGEVNNGGLSQYFFNSSGDHWRDALAGLEAMGSTERLAVLREALSRFGKDGPSQDRAQEELAKLARKNDALFDVLDDRYYKSKEVIEALTKRYVLKNSDAFK